MNTYIPKQIRKERERIETKLDRELVDRLELYCRYIESDRDYVIASALEIAFRKDKGFNEWLEVQRGSDSRTDPSQSEPQGERAKARKAAGEV